MSSVTSPASKSLARTPLRTMTPNSRRRRTMALVERPTAENTIITRSSARKKRRLSTDEKLRQLTPLHIQRRISLLFPRDPGILSLPCMSARLFACYTFALDRGSGRMQQDDLIDYEAVQPVLGLLAAIVQQERVCHGKMVRPGMVQFAAFDGSSTKPARDNVVGSHVSREESIEALQKIVSEVHSLFNVVQEYRYKVIACLLKLSCFLARMERDTGDTITLLRELCGRAMPMDRWPPTRFCQPAKCYREDCDKVRLALEGATGLPSNGNLELLVETQLAGELESAIRYHLRRLFNPLYNRPATCEDLDDARLERCNTRHSRISELLVMKLPEWYLMSKKESAVADGSVSYVFSLAVESIVSYVGADEFVAGDFVVPVPPDVFCSSQASEQGLGSRKRPVAKLTDDDMNEIRNDILSAQSFLAAAKACRFLLTLFDWPGVRDEIRKCGGWGIIEEHAQTMRRLHLNNLVPSGAHFVVLGCMDMFLSRVSTLWRAMKSKVETCTTALDEVYHKFDCDTVNGKRLRKYPEIKVIRELLLEGLERHMFPTIAQPETEEGSSSEESDGSESAEDTA